MPSFIAFLRGINVGGHKKTETFDAEEVHSAEQQIAGGSAILENFRKYVESL